MDVKFLGSILLIAGTSIGGGLLSLPAATATAGFTYSISLIIAAWAITLIASLYIMEVSLTLPRDTNLVSMTRHTLGRLGGLFCWTSYLLLLYSLICVYISGGTDLLNDAFSTLHIRHHTWFNSILFTVVFGIIVIRGIGLVDKTNRMLMSTKVICFVMLIFFLMPLVDVSKLTYLDSTGISGALMPIIFSFGYSIIVPSLRSYLQDDIKKIRLAIIIGSIIPMIAYIIWIVIVHGTVNHSLLVNSNSSGKILSALNAGLGATGKSMVAYISYIFTCICIATSFLGVSISMSDFVADGIKKHKKGIKNKSIIYGLTFIPSLIIVLFYPYLYMTALRFAGILCVIILIMIPAATAYASRNVKTSNGYKVFGGNTLVSTVLLISIILFIYAVIHSG